MSRQLLVVPRQPRVVPVMARNLFVVPDHPCAMPVPDQLRVAAAVATLLVRATSSVCQAGAPMALRPRVTPINHPVCRRTPRRDAVECRNGHRLIKPGRVRRPA
jgi:hypothetical protein